MIACQKAVKHIMGLLDKMGDVEDDRLPTIKMIAHDCGVSVVTAWKAVRHLVSIGLIKSSPRDGIRRISNNVNIPASLSFNEVKSVMTRWQQVAIMLQEDILNGVYKAGTRLPTLKALSAKYNSCNRDLKKSLGYLHNEHLITPYHRGYSVVPLQRKTRLDTIILIAAGDSSGSLVKISDRTHDIVEVLEQECHSSGLNLETITFNPLTGEFYKPIEISIRDIVDEKSTILIGFMLWITNLLPSRYADVLGMIEAYSKPIAVLNETAEDAFAELKSRYSRLFSIGVGTSPGRVVGYFLKNLGHRKVAFISNFHSFSGWSEQRLIGLRNSFGNFTDTTAIRSFTADSFIKQYAFIQQRHEDMAELRDALSKQIKKYRTMKKQFEMACTQIAKVNLEEIVFNQAKFYDLQPLFEQALRFEDITAWVGANDDIAVSMLQFLHSKGINVPEDISVIGFDDGENAFMHRLTSYNFNGPTQIRNLLSYILHPKSSLWADHKKIYELEGFVNMRKTVKVYK